MMSILTKERHELEKLDQEEKKERELQAAKKQKMVDQKVLLVRMEHSRKLTSWVQMDKQLQDDVRSTIYSKQSQPTMREVIERCAGLPSLT